MSGLWVIANPNAAGGRAARVMGPLERALTAAGASYVLRRTEGPGHAALLAGEARALRADRLLIVGGDGTVHEAVQGLMGDAIPGAKPPFAVLPVGTGNDFHRMVRSGTDVSAAVRTVLEGVPRRFEVGEVSWRTGTAHVVNLVGVGIDAALLRERPRFERFPGLLQYLAAFGAALSRYEPVPLRVTVHGRAGPDVELEVEALLAAVTVGPHRRHF